MKRKNEVPEQETMRTRDILLSLTNARPALLKLKNCGKPYDPLIDVLVDIGEDDPIPKNKDLQQQFSITHTILRKWVETLYADFTTRLYDDLDFLTITQVKHLIVMTGRKRSFNFFCQLPTTPRVGESFSLPFLSALLGDTPYYVSDIRYLWVDSEFWIEVWLEEGTYNRYFHFLFDRALFENKIDYLAILHKAEYSIKELLRKIYPR